MIMIRGTDRYVYEVTTMQTVLGHLREHPMRWKHRSRESPVVYKRGWSVLELHANILDVFSSVTKVDQSLLKACK